MARTPGKPIPLLDAVTLDQFATKLKPGDYGCIHWVGSLNGNGYGLFSVRGQQYLAHRVAWTLVNGAIPDDLEIDHMCCNRDCVNADHLDTVSSAENNHRKVRPAQGWEPVPESTCFPFTFGNQSWHEVQWYVLDEDHRVKRRSRGFDTLEEAQAFQAELVATPYLGRPRTPVEELPDDIRVKLEKCYTSDAMLAWLKQKNRRLHDERPLELIRAGRVDEVRECLSWVKV